MTKPPNRPTVPGLNRTSVGLKVRHADPIHLLFVGLNRTSVGLKVCSVGMRICISLCLNRTSVGLKGTPVC